MSELFTQLFTLQLSMMFVSNFFEVGLPFIMKKIKIYTEERDAKKESKSTTGSAAIPQISFMEQQMNSTPYSGVVEEYTELIIQFGYVTLFACAFPLSSLAAFLNNLIELRVDAIKVLYGTQRPKYEGCEDIGTWLPIMEFISLVAVVSNCAIICFTSQVFKGKPADRSSSDYSNCVMSCNTEEITLYQAIANTSLASPHNWTYISDLYTDTTKLQECLKGCACATTYCLSLTWRLWIFVVAEHLLIGAKLLLSVLIPDVPADILRAEERAKVEHELAEHDRIEGTLVGSQVERLNDTWDATAFDAEEIWAEPKPLIE